MGKCRGWGWNPAAKKREGEFLFFLFLLGSLHFENPQARQIFFYFFLVRSPEMREIPGRGKNQLWWYETSFSLLSDARHWGLGKGEDVFFSVVYFCFLYKCFCYKNVTQHWGNVIETVFPSKKSLVPIEGTFHFFFKKNLPFLPFPHLICGNVCVVVESEIPFPLSPCHKKRREEDAIHVELMPFFLSFRGSHTCNIFPLSCCPHTHISPFPLLFRV